MTSRILAVDDEADILEVIAEELEGIDVDVAADFKTAAEKINQNQYDLTVLDIMGVDGLTLLKMAVEKKIPAVMLTAHALDPEILMESIQKGAISYLPKEKLAELDDLLNAILGAFHRNEPTWELLLEKLWNYFTQRWGPGWQEKNPEFWSEFRRAYSTGKEIQERFLK